MISQDVQQPQLMIMARRQCRFDRAWLSLIFGIGLAAIGNIGCPEIHAGPLLCEFITDGAVVS
jgi:hypothetical protein